MWAFCRLRGLRAEIGMHPRKALYKGSLLSLIVFNQLILIHVKQSIQDS